MDEGILIVKFMDCPEETPSKREACRDVGCQSQTGMLRLWVQLRTEGKGDSFSRTEGKD